MTSFEDGINAGRQAMDYRCKSSQVKAGEQLAIKMVRMVDLQLSLNDGTYSNFPY